MLRNYARSLVMFKTEPGEAGLELTPDLATDLGKSSDGGKTWTYTLQEGPEVRGRLGDHRRPTSSTPCCAPPTRRPSRTGRPTSRACSSCPKGYDGPYRSKDMNTDSAIETPDD